MSVALIVNNDNEAHRILPWAKLLSRGNGDELHVIIAQEKEGPREWEEIELREPEPLADSDGASDEKANDGDGARDSADDDTDSTSGADSTSDLDLTTRRLAGVEKSETADDVQSPDEESEDEDDTVVITTTHRLRDPAPDRALLELIPKLGASLLVLPLDELVRESEKEWKGRLYRTSTCETMYLRTGSEGDRLPTRILVPTGGGTNASAALRRAELIAATVEGEVTAVYVQGQAGELTPEIGERVLDRNLRTALGRRKSEAVRKKVVIGRDVMDGIQESLASSPHLFDLVIIGAYRHRTIRKIFFGKLANECFSGEDSPAFAAVRAGLPFGTRFQQFCERQVQRFVPQLDRENRVALVERVQTSSNWDFDFIALICLSTCIAALGLVRNQSAVVIGAMLVAPLMTPLAGAGLALVQGNGALIKSALRSVLFGFLLAYGIGILVGLFVPLGDHGIAPELIARTSPGFVDLLVALVGGIAAAYAMSRPHLSSALPGVAIAAALVPPIATSGIMLANGEWAFARGSVLLFLTNIVAIILGTAISLRLVGIRDAHHHGTSQRWSRRFAAFLLAMVVLLSFAISHRAPRTGQAAIDELKEKIKQVVKEVVETDADGNPVANGATVVSATKTGQSELTVVVESPEDELGDLPARIHAKAVKHFDDEALSIKLEVRHVVKVPAVEEPEEGEEELGDGELETEDEGNDEKREEGIDGVDSVPLSLTREDAAAPKDDAETDVSSEGTSGEE